HARRSARASPTYSSGRATAAGRSFTSMCRFRRRRAARSNSGHVAPVAKQVLLDELEPGEVIRIHLETLKRGNFVQFVQKVAAERILDPALDEGNRDQPLAL